MKNENECTCGNPECGFDCICDHMRKHPGKNEYECEYCGIYDSNKPRCNKCELINDAKNNM